MDRVNRSIPRPNSEPYFENYNNSHPTSSQRPSLSSFMNSFNQLNLQRSHLPNHVTGVSSGSSFLRPQSEVLGLSKLQSSETEAIDRMYDDLSYYEQALHQMAAVKLDNSFNEELRAIMTWFKVITEAEKTTVLYSLLHYLNPVQVRFFLTVLQQLSQGEGSGSSLEKLEEKTLMAIRANNVKRLSERLHYRHSAPFTESFQANDHVSSHEQSLRAQARSIVEDMRAKEAFLNHRPANPIGQSSDSLVDSFRSPFASSGQERYSASSLTAMQRSNSLNSGYSPFPHPHLRSSSPTRRDDTSETSDSRNKEKGKIPEVVDMDCVRDVPSWLRSLRLHKYTPLFQSMSWKDMVKMTDEDLERVGVAALGARRKMLKVFEKVIEHCQSEGISI